ncbi:unnamed protein product [Clonostachys rosea]|uniref:Uncharacterized protein n=1 Tax=Bionectria ochroleuca TaxID=29856 RepID=A0ABY6UHF9_BIOOC|nr:unnamed protein product [Clonostachys rosea]
MVCYKYRTKSSIDPTSSALINSTSAASIDRNERISPLGVKVKQLGNTGFKVDMFTTEDPML